MKKHSIISSFLNSAQNYIIPNQNGKKEIISDFNYPFFDYRYTYTGNWTSKNNQSILGNFTQTSGQGKFAFYQFDLKQYEIYLKILDGKYIDQKFAVLTPQVYTTNFDEKTATFTYNNLTNVTLADHYGGSAYQTECNIN